MTVGIHGDQLKNRHPVYLTMSYTPSFQMISWQPASGGRVTTLSSTIIHDQKVRFKNFITYCLLRLSKTKKCVLETALTKFFPRLKGVF